MQRKSLYTGQHIFIFDYRNRFRRCNAQTLIFSMRNFRVDYEIEITKLQRERLATAGLPILGLYFKYSCWRNYEEPLQTSCLGKN